MDDLDRWTRVLPLGAGAFGEVHLAWDRVDGRWVACKRFTGQDELGLLRMVIESRIRVSHPHLVRTLAFRLVDDQAWLMTELARGGSLRALTARTGALPWGWVAEAVDQILMALSALHATGVVHRDLKPANLLLRSHGESHPHLLVGDFGIATWRTVSMTGIGAAIGTPGYLAPEYLDGHQPCPATDLFAVGVLAAELLSGRRLVHYSNASPTMPSSWHDRVPIPGDVPLPLSAVLQRLADPDPGRRYTDSTQAREALLSACPPQSRPNLTSVVAPDLLAALPPGWTPDGPEQQTTAVRATPAPTTEEPPPNLVALPIDGGPTALVPENEPTLTPDGSPTPLAAAPPASAIGSSTQPPSGSSTQPPISSSTHPSSGPATHPPTGSPTRQPADSPTGSPTGSSTEPPSDPANSHPASPASSAGQEIEPSPASAASSPVSPIAASAPSPIASSPALTPGPNTSTPDLSPPPPQPAPGLPAAPVTPASGLSTQPPSGSATSAKASKARRKARRRRKFRQAVLLVILVAFAAGAGTLWWAANHRTVAGQASGAGRATSPSVSASHWVPVLVAPCSRVERTTTRQGANGTERCQRTPTQPEPQHWVEEPPTGFPKSNAEGPFPGEPCVADGDKDYSPVGDHVVCEAKTWQVIA